MGRFVKGDIVVLSYPFSDFSGAKRRPALVIADLDGDDIILCQITSQVKADRYALKIEEKDFTDGKLNVGSVIRPNKIFTVDLNVILYTACKISIEKTDAVIKVINNIMTYKTEFKQKGKIIYLSGVTSTGKTSIARAMQEMSDEFFYLVSTDNIRSMISKKYLSENFFKYEFKLYIDMYYFAKILSDIGNNVILDGVLFETAEFTNHYQEILNILKNNPLLTVNVACPLEICRERNILRGDRGEFQSAEQDAMADKNSVLDFCVKTDIKSPEECAAMILQKLAETFT